MSKKLRKTSRRQRMRLLAEVCARFAHEEEFDTPSGCFRLDCAKLELDPDDGVLVCVYDNYPFKAGSQFRERQLCRFRQRLDQRGYRELAFAGYPPEGQEQAGYTFAMIIDDGTPEMLEEVAAIYQEETRRTVDELLRLPK
jgi:hypothetical protein